MTPASRSQRLRTTAAATSLGEAGVQQPSTIVSVTGGSAAGMTQDWTKLFPELIAVVANVLLLTDVKEYISLRAVCKAWRGATTKPRLLDPRFFPRNWILMQRKTKLGNTMGRFVNVLTGCSLRIELPVEHGSVLANAEGYLVLDHKSTSRLLLFDPMTAATADLPYLNVRRISRRPTMDFTPEVTSAGIIYRGDGTVTLVLCCLTQWTMDNEAIFCAKPGDTAWVKVDTSCLEERRMRGVHVFKGGLSMGGNFYVPTRSGNVLKVELSPAPHLVYVARQEEHCFRSCDLGMGSYLVPSLDIDDTNDGMLLVSNLYDVFGVKLAEGRLTRLHDIGNRTIFLGSSATLRTDKFPSLAKKRRILRENAGMFLGYN